MLTLRTEGHLLRRSRIRPEARPPRSTGKLGDWYATPLEASPCPVVLCVSASTGLPVLVTATDAGHLTEQLVTGTRDVLRGIGVAEADIERELDHMCEVRFARPPSRRSAGPTTDLERMLSGRHFDGSPRELLAKSLQLAKAPPADGQSPERATLALFQRPKLRLVK